MCEDQKISSKVGDTLTAEVSDGTAGTGTYTYQWYADGEAISGATKSSYTVTEADLGKKISVIVTRGDATATAETAAVIDKLVLVSADQTGAKVVKVTANGPITANDKLTVKKRSAEVKVDSVSYTDNVAAITLADKIVEDVEYTVTLTPADGDPATTVTFTGERATLDRIEFLSDKLVMKDNNYAEGYAYVKGYDQFDGEVNLSGLTVTPGVGQFKSYDSNTGKVTIVDNNYDGTSAGAFMLIKEVPMFVQYQNGSDVLTASANLQVDGRAYVSNVVFGAISKDGTKREDGKLTVTELASNKYYIPLTTVEDQYGNTLDADDLNDQLDDNVLFVIPGTTGAFYTTARFGTVDGVTALWLASAADPKPGEMALTVTGASGKSFSTDVTVEDDPFIDTLAVTYPELYSEQAESGVLEFTAKDQYGNEVDLWDFAPSASGNKLTFTDKNHMTGVSTTITASGNAYFNVVAKDTVKKTFKVTVNASALEPKTVVVFTTTTAGTKVGTASITVGEIGTAAKVKSTLKNANTQLDPDSATSYNFNANLQFEDANGNTMVRGIAENYPYFIQSVSVAKPLGSSVKASDLTQFAWTLSDTKPVENKAVTSVNSTGVISYGDFNAKKDYYVGLYGTPNGGTDWYLLNTASFHMTAVVGADKSYAITGGTMYTDAVEDAATLASVGASVKVVATTENNETYTVKASRISLAADDKYTLENNKITPTAGSVFYLEKDSETNVPVTVYVDGEDRDTINMKLTNKVPVASSVVYDHASTTVGSTLNNISRVGASVSGGMYSEDFETMLGATLVFNGGKLTLTNVATLADTVTGSIKDQYGQVMADTELFINGEKATDGQVLKAGKRYTIQYTNQSKSQKFVVTPWSDINCVVGANGVNWTVTSAYELNTALAAAAEDSNPNTITVGANITASKDVVVPAGDTLVVAGGKTLALGKKTLTNNGTVTLGDDDASANGTLTVSGDVTNAGTMNLYEASALTNTGNTFTNTGKINNESTGAVAFITLENDGTIAEKAGIATATTVTDIEGAGTITGSTAGTWTIGAAAGAEAGASLENILGQAKQGKIVMTNASAPTGDLVVPAKVDLTLTGALTLASGKKLTNNGKVTVTGVPVFNTGAGFVSNAGSEWSLAANTNALDEIITGATTSGSVKVDLTGANATNGGAAIALTIPAGMVITTNANNLTFDAAVTNNGVIDAAGAATVTIAAGKTFENDGTINLAVAGSKIAAAGASAVFDNYGTIDGAGALDTDYMTANFYNGEAILGQLTDSDTVAGTLNVDGGYVELSGAPSITNALAAINVKDGTLVVNGAVAAANLAPIVLAGGTLDLSGVTLQATSTIGSSADSTIVLPDKVKTAAGAAEAIDITKPASGSCTITFVVSGDQTIKENGVDTTSKTIASTDTKITLANTAAAGVVGAWTVTLT